MPYIKSGDGRREALQRGEPALTAGELNYQIFYYVKHFDGFKVLDVLNPVDEAKFIIKKYIDQFLGEKPNYQKYNDMTGALIRCTKEINRRLLGVNPYILLEIMTSYDDEIAKYEDLKIKENGDVE